MFTSWISRFFGKTTKPSRRQRRAARPATRSEFRPRLEALEDRVMLNADYWKVGSGNWDVKSNWSLGYAPGTGDTAIINTTTAVTITIQSSDNINVHSVTTGSNDKLSIAGGSLTVTSGVSTLSGALSMSGGNLIANGSGVSLSAKGSTAISGASLYAENGASLSMPQMTSYIAKGSNFEAEGKASNGTRSVLDVSALKSVTIAGNWSINAYNGGEVKLTGMTSLNSSSYGTVFINDDGGSNGGSLLLDSNVTSLNGVNASLDGSDAQVANSWTKFTSGNLSVTTGSYSLSKLTDVNDSSLYVGNGGSLALPGLTSYTAKGNNFQAEGTASNGTRSVLDVSALKSVTIAGNWSINAYNGGEVKLTGMTSLNSSSYGTVFINDDGGSNGGSLLLDSNVTSLNGVNASLDGSDTQVANSWTKFTGGNLSVTGGSYSLSKLTNVNDSSLYVDNGGSLALPGLTSYTAKGNNFQANGTAPDGTASVLDVSALKTVTIAGNWSINAYNGGEVKLTGMTSLNSSSYGTVFINDTGSSELLDSNVTTLKGVNAYMDGTDTQVGNSWTSFSGGSLSDTGGSLDFAKMSSFAGSLYLSGGAALSIAGAVNNSGTVSVDAGCNLTIGGSYTQASNSSFDVQIDATQSPALFGQVVVKGAAKLAGYFNVDLVDGTTPPSGTVFPVMTYAGESGTFSSVSGLGSTFTMHVNSTRLDLVTN